MRRASTSYVPRRPHDTVLHRLVRAHYASFVAHAEATYAAPLPRYVKDAFERYLTCGDFSQGFVRCHCEGCGHWVMSLPFELRGLAATKPDVLTALGRIFAEEVACATRPRQAVTGVAGAETGATSFPQRFGGSLKSLRALPPVAGGRCLRESRRRHAPARGPASVQAGPLRPSIAPSPLEAATTITVKHWRRILDGELFATSARVDWATLMRRTFGFDALPTEPLRRARARDPTGQTDFGDFAA